MKYLSILTILFLSSCINHIKDEEEQEKTKEITFRIRMDIKEFPNSRVSSKEIHSFISNLCYMDYFDETLISKIEQVKTEPGFGTINSNLKYGDHKLFFVGHNSTSISYDYSFDLASFDKVMDTFIYFKELIVDDKTTISQPITLNRSVSRVEIKATDAIPKNIYSMEMKVTNYSDKISLKTGKGINELTSIERKFIYTDNQKGMENTFYYIYAFLPSDNDFVNIEMQALDANKNILYSHSFQNVPIFKNKITCFSGKFFTDKSISSDFSILADKDWDETIEKEY